jgi:hypothetical protein
VVQEHRSDGATLSALKPSSPVRQRCGRRELLRGHRTFRGKLFVVSDFVITRWNGKVQTTVDHVCKKSAEPKLYTELQRIALTPSVAALPLVSLEKRFAGFVAKARLAIEQDAR